MKTIKGLTVKVTYIAELSDIEVPEKVYDILKECCEDGEEIAVDSHSATVTEWLADNICESDAMAWKYEIYNIVESTN